MNIRRVNDDDSRIDGFINEEFSSYAEQNNVNLNFNVFCFIAESDSGEILGAITGRAYYNEVLRCRYIALTNGLTTYCYEYDGTKYSPCESFPCAK